MLRYSLTRAINKLASHQSLDGVEGEINKELQSNMGRRPTGHGLMVPINALLPKRKAALTDNSNTVATEKLVELRKSFRAWSNSMMEQQWIRQDGSNAEAGGKLKAVPSPSNRNKGLIRDIPGGFSYQ